MQFLADENFPFERISLLIAQGFKVRKAATVYQGKPDIFLLQEAILNKEILLTFDKDFGELIFKSIVKDCEGVVLFRLDKYLPSTPGLILLNLIKEAAIIFTNNLTVIDEHKIRQRPIF